MTTPLEARLADVVGAAHVLTEPALRAPYEADWTRRFGGPSVLVVRPGCTDEVAAVVRLCAAAGVAIVAQGGNTGLVGGGVPRNGEVLLSLRRLDDVSDVDEVGQRLTAGAGATLAAVQLHARRSGLEFGIDLASRDSATVGGLIATNAGGVRVVRHGTMRAQLRGIEVVFADGAVVTRLAGTAHDNSGYDLAGLLAGSEGTLGIITRATLALVAAPASRAVGLIGLPDTADAVRLATALRRLPDLDALELVYADGLALVCAHAGMRPPLSAAYPVYVLVEVAGERAEEQLGETLAGLAAVDVAFAVAPDDRRRLWAYRERISESIAAAASLHTLVPHKLDVALPLGRLADFMDLLHPLIESVAPGTQVVVFGHLGVGNLHINLLGPAVHDVGVDDAVLALVARLGGSIGAEHGIGTAKRDYLSWTRSAADIAAMRAIKSALDPAGLLNPGVLLPPV